MRRLAGVILLVVAMMIATPVLADRGGNGQGRAGGVRTEGLSPDGEHGSGGRARRTPPVTPGPIVSATPEATPRSTRAAVTDRFSARGYFARWSTANAMVLDDAWTSSAGRPAIDDEGYISVIVSADTRYHVYGGGGGYTTGLQSVSIPIGARVQVQGVVRYLGAASGASAEAPLLFADKVIVDLDLRSTNEDAN